METEILEKKQKMFWIAFLTLVAIATICLGTVIYRFVTGKSVTEILPWNSITVGSEKAPPATATPIFSAGEGSEVSYSTYTGLVTAITVATSADLPDLTGYMLRTTSASGAKVDYLLYGDKTKVAPFKNACVEVKVRKISGTGNPRVSDMDVIQFVTIKGVNKC